FNQRLVVNPETAGRYHSDWLSMMYPRLKLARNLLTDDGVIFISIDDNEAHNLRKICDEILGESNFITSIMWKRKKEISSDSKNVAKQGENIVVYGKSILTEFKLEPLSKEYVEKSYKVPNDEFPLGKWRPVPITVSKGLSGGGYEYEVTTPSGNKHKRLFAYPPKSYEKLLQEKRIYFGKNGEGVPQRVIYDFESKGQPTTNYWDNTSSNKQGKKEILELFDSNVFDTPKPSNLISRLSALVLKSDDTMLDFFAGSSASAHAVVKLNSQDKGRRKFIMVQIPEATDEKSEAYKSGYKNICEIGKERIRRAAKKIKDETGVDLDYGFRVYCLDSSNMQDVYYRPQDYQQSQLDAFADNVKPDRTPDDLLAQIMLDWGLPLSLKINTRDIAGKKVYMVAENSLYACFDQGIDEDFAKEIAKDEPLRVVFRDSGFKSDTAKVNVRQLLKQLSPETEMKVI
ncbi:site-specific DNA-methyltransferase, partial [Echinicola sediminis]